MYNGIGLPTPRGTGTSGYIQKNLSSTDTRRQAFEGHYARRQKLAEKDAHSRKILQRDGLGSRQIDEEILAHDRKRDIEVKCFELRDKLEDEGVAEDVIEQKVQELRQRLERRAENMNRRISSTSQGSALRSYDSHEVAAAKREENARMQRAFGLDKRDAAGGTDSVPLTSFRRRRESHSAARDHRMRHREEEELYDEAAALPRKPRRSSFNSDDGMTEEITNLRKPRSSRDYSPGRRWKSSDIGGYRKGERNNDQNGNRGGAGSRTRDEPAESYVRSDRPELDY